MGTEFTKFYSKLSELLSDKRKQSKPLTVNWLRTKLCLGLLKPVYCVCEAIDPSIVNNIRQSVNNMTVTNELA